MRRVIAKLASCKFCKSKQIRYRNDYPASDKRAWFLKHAKGCLGMQRLKKDIEEPEVIVIKRKGLSLPMKLYRTNKKFRQEWDEFIETLETGRRIGFRAGLAEGIRQERKRRKKVVAAQPTQPIKRWCPHCDRSFMG